MFNKRLIPLNQFEEPIVDAFERQIQKGGDRISRPKSRYIFEQARSELRDRARERGEWSLISELYKPEPGSKAEKLLSLYMRTLYEEVDGKLPDLEEEDNF